MARLLTGGDEPRDPGAKQFELDGWIDTAPFEDLLGMTIEEAAAGRAVVSMPFPVKLAQGGGLMHGGALTALADTAVALAVKSLLPAGSTFVTAELTTRFLAPVTGGRVTAAASVRGPQDRTFYGKAAVTDDEGREVIRFDSVFRLVRPRQGAS